MAKEIAMEKAGQGAPDASAKFRKTKLLTFARYAGRRDLLTALLTDDRIYSLAEADAVIETFMKEKRN